MRAGGERSLCSLGVSATGLPLPAGGARECPGRVRSAQSSVLTTPMVLTQTGPHPHSAVRRLVSRSQAVRLAGDDRRVAGLPVESGASPDPNRMRTGHKDIGRARQQRPSGRLPDLLVPVIIHRPSGYYCAFDQGPESPLLPGAIRDWVQYSPGEDDVHASRIADGWERQRRLVSVWLACGANCTPLTSGTPLPRRSIKPC